MRNLIWVLFVFSLLAPATFGQDTSALKPPAEATVAILVFEDLQCPECARTEPVLEQAVAKYKIPVVRHDVPIRSHNWSFEAHVMGRYFTSRSPQVGEQYWRFIYANQGRITKLNLRGVADEFARQNGTTLPSLYDPNGTLAELVRQDLALAQRIGVQYTPAIYVVGNTPHGVVVQTVADRNQLFQVIEKVLAESTPPKAPAPAGKAKKH